MSRAKVSEGPEPGCTSVKVDSPLLPERISSFVQYKAQHATVQGHNESSVYDPSSEQYPDDDWYTLEHDSISSNIHDMCTPVLRAVRNHHPNDNEVSNLDKALRTANTIPHSQQFYVAFLGEQGIGKSSLINAVFNRDLVTISASSSACTAYPTIITYKAGASDESTTSDVRVEYLSDEEIRECAQEQARRYRAAFPLKARDEQNRNAEDLPRISLEHSLSEDENDDEDPISDMPNSGFSQHRTVGSSVLRGAKTAKSFFEIIFSAEDIEGQAAILQEDLDSFDIEGECFVHYCVKAARGRLSAYGIQSGFSKPDTIEDDQLADFHEVNGKIWPLVKSVRIETGHVLLRNNVGILDLPGYGDDNHIRTTIIDKFREMANFEIVVAPCSREVSSVVQERYLNRSIRRLGSRNTLLVTNKSDQLFSGIRKHINKIKEAPFPVLKEHLASIESTAKEGIEDQSLVRGYRDYLLKKAREAYIQREASIVRLSMQDKDVDILFVSAREYSLCLGAEYAEEDDEKPKLTPEATGLPQLRRYLFHVPAQTNYRTLHYHVFETLPDIVRRIERILEKFDDDEGYLLLREYLAVRLPQVRSSIMDLAKSLPRDRVFRPFMEARAKSHIKTNLKSVVQALDSPRVCYQTFSKMLKENGIPVNGSGLGLNMNQEILTQMAVYINKWHQKMQAATEEIAEKLDEPVQNALRELRKHVHGYEGNPDLKHQATELLESTTRRTGMAYGKMAALLQTKLQEVYFLYSNEINIKSPIALAMKDIYRDVLVQQLAQPGAGSYARQRAHLLESLVNPDWPKLPLSEIMEQKIVKAQVKSWRECCGKYAVEAITLLQHFARETDELLDNGQHLTSEHQHVREQLETRLPTFKRRLRRVQNQFPGATTTQDSDLPSGQKAVSNKRKADGVRAATQVPSLRLSKGKRLRLSSQPSSARATSARPVAGLHKKNLSRSKKLPGLVIKEEASP